MRLAALAFLIALVPAAAKAQQACGQLKILNIVHMIPTLDGDADIVPVVIGGKPRSFLLDTGGYLSQISRPLAQEQHLFIHQERQQVFDAAGNISQDQVTVPQLGIGEVTTPDVVMMVSPSLGAGGAQGVEGLLAPDRLAKYDVEMDFGNDTLNLFSPDHCPGRVVYWSPPVVAIVPITLEQVRYTLDGRDPSIARERPVAPSSLATNAPLQGFHIFVPVTLDGHVIKALVDTGASTSALRMDDARDMFGLTMGSPDTPEKGGLNGHADLKMYSHLFQSLSFGTVTVRNPRLTIVPNAMSRNVVPDQLVGDRTRTERDLINAPELIIGMDVLRRLRIYFAFQEEKMYISPSSAPALTDARPYTREFITAMLSRLDGILADSPDDPDALNDRCFWRGIAKENLDGALADCDKSLRLQPGIAATLDSRAFVLFQQGKYQDALAGYEAALKADSNQSPSLWMRGLVKGKLGDTAGHDADIAAAEKADVHIALEFKRIGISAD